VTSTRSRSGGREHARPAAGGVAAEHAPKIFAIAGAGIVVIVAFLALTGVGHVIDAATQHFMLFYAGVFALIGLCASVGLGLVATGRMFLNPGRRVFIQSAHRAASFGAVTFLVIHIVTEILAQRVHVIDAVIPFLSPFRTFYIGLGTIASDLIILLVITGILRGRFNAGGKAWRWRAIHYTSYAAFVFGVWHGLLGGRPGKPYVDWSYGFLVALVLLGLAVRVFSRSLKPKENLSGPPVPMMSPAATAPLRAAAMAAQLSVARGGIRGAPVVMGAQRALTTPFGAPVITATALPAGGPQPVPAGQPYYEPGYEGPARYLGAPRSTGPIPRPPTGPLPRVTVTGPQRAAATGPQPRPGPGPLSPPHPSGPFRVAGPGPRPRPGLAPLPPHPSGPFPVADTGPQPRFGAGPLPPHPSAPFPVAGTGPQPRYRTGPLPQHPSGPFRPESTGPFRPESTGPFRPESTGPLPVYEAGGSRPRPVPGPQPGREYGPFGRGDIRPSSPSGPLPSAATGPQAQAGASRRPQWEPGPPRQAAGPIAWAAGDPRPGDAWQWQSTGPVPPGYDAWADSAPSQGDPFYGDPSYDDRSYGDAVYGVPPRGAPVEHNGSRPPGRPPWEGGMPEADLGLRYREPGPGMPGYRGSRDNRYGGDRRR
jgi:DMSO/TMAO reductase YedYZ heme-binding membrane subunit